jgi:hypothetical protein
MMNSECAERNPCRSTCSILSIDSAVEIALELCRHKDSSKSKCFAINIKYYGFYDIVQQIIQRNVDYYLTNHDEDFRNIENYQKHGVFE